MTCFFKGNSFSIMSQKPAYLYYLQHISCQKFFRRLHPDLINSGREGEWNPRDPLTIVSCTTLLPPPRSIFLDTPLPAIGSCVVTARVFHPCYSFPGCQGLRFPPLRFLRSRVVRSCVSVATFPFHQPNVSNFLGD